MAPVLYLVLPCYNEEEVLPSSVEKLLKKYSQLVDEDKISTDSRLLFVNDGSRDKTWSIIAEQFSKHSEIAGVNLSRNRGHQHAVHAGLMVAKERADLAISIDADLQQDLAAIDLMLEKYNEGCDIVYGIRNDRGTDGFVKKTTALGFYKLMQVMGCEVIKNHADYRMMSKRTMEALAEYKEVNLFLRGLVPELGFKTDVVYFDVKEREAGVSKYTMKKMLSFAVDGITSFSIKPLQMITFVGLLILFISLFMIASTIYDYLMGKTVAGWPTTVCSIWFLGSVQLISIGIMGEYIGKIYMETKARPRYHIESVLWKETK